MIFHLKRAGFKILIVITGGEKKSSEKKKSPWD